MTELTADQTLRMRCLEMAMRCNEDVTGEMPFVVKDAAQAYDFVMLGTTKPADEVEPLAQATVSELDKRVETPAPASMSGTLTPAESAGVIFNTGESLSFHNAGSSGLKQPGPAPADPSPSTQATQPTAQAEPETDPKPAPTRKAKGPRKAKAKKARAAGRTRGNGHACEGGETTENTGASEPAEAAKESAMVSAPTEATAAVSEQQMAA